MSASAAAAPTPAKTAPIARRLGHVAQPRPPVLGREAHVDRAVVADRADRELGRGEAHRERRAGARRHEHRPPEGPAQQRGRAAHEPHEQRHLDRRAGGEEHELAVAVVASALELGGREVRSRVDRHGRDDAVTWPQQQDRRLRDDEGSNHGHGNPAGAFHVRKECPTAQAGREIHAGRHRLRHPRQPPRLRGGARRRAGQPRRGDLVPGRHRRLRGRSQRLLPRSRASTPTSAWPATTTSPSRATSTSASSPPAPRLAARWTQEVIDAGHRDWLASLKPVGRPSAASGSTTRRPATRSGSTSSPPCWPSCASTPSPSACRSSATRTWRCRSCAPRASRPPARRAGAARRSTSPTASGSSTRAASASRATATRVRPGCCSTPAPGSPAGGASSTTSPGAAAAIRAARLPDSLAERLEYGQ